MFRKGGEAVCVVGRNAQIRKIHTTFQDGSELLEEYDNKTRQLLLRKRRKATQISAPGTWEVLQGPTAPAPAAAAAGGTLMQESALSQPVCLRQDTPGCYTWRISNLTYHPSVYSITADPNNTSIVVSTYNKKYYKRLAMPEMVMLGLVLDPGRLTWSHESGTLTIHYSKPPALLAEELADLRDAMAMRLQEHPSECKQQ